MRKIVLFDIDHTLFDASLYRKRVLELIANNIIYPHREKLEKTLESIYYSHREKIGHVDLEFMIEEVIRELQLEENAAKIYKDLLEDEASYEEAIFEETRDVLKELAKHKELRIGILSGGREDHQMKKISSFTDIFRKEHIHILRRKAKEVPSVIEKYHGDKIFLIDDVLEILYVTKKVHSNCTTIWMKRGRLIDEQKPIPGFEPDYTIYNLKEVIPILTKSKGRS